MDQNVLRTKWKQCRNELNRQWKQFTEEDIDRVDGERDNLVFLLESRYGYARRRAEREADLFVSEFEDRLRRAS